LAILRLAEILKEYSAVYRVNICLDVFTEFLNNFNITTVQNVKAICYYLSAHFLNLL